MSDTPEFRVKVTVRNNLLLSAIESAGWAGWGGLTRFCNDTGVCPNHLSALISLRVAPITTEGEFSTTAKAIMEALGAAPSDLWTEPQMTMALRRNSGEWKTTEAGVRELLKSHEERMTLASPEDAADESSLKRAVRAVLGMVPPREEKVLRLRFGIDSADLTLDECGVALGVTRERVRQIEARALRRLRDPAIRAPVDDVR